MTQDRFIQILARTLVSSGADARFITLLNADRTMRTPEFFPVGSIREAVERGLLPIASDVINRAFVWPANELFGWFVLSYQFGQTFEEEEKKE
jgi:hypothetical protein